jgi:hypothetical protein
MAIFNSYVKLPEGSWDILMRVPFHRSIECIFFVASVVSGFKPTQGKTWHTMERKIQICITLGYMIETNIWLIYQ